jgi:hypothetical protein
VGVTGRCLPLRPYRAPTACELHREVSRRFWAIPAVVSPCQHDLSAQLKNLCASGIIGLETVLDEESVQRVIKWADDMRANMTMSSGDLERMFEVESVDPQAILERMCSQP